MEHTTDRTQVGAARWIGGQWQSVRTGARLSAVFRIVRAQVGTKRCGIMMPDAWCDVDSAYAAALQHALREQDTALDHHGGGYTDTAYTDDGALLIVRGADGWAVNVEWVVMSSAGAP